MKFERLNNDIFNELEQSEMEKLKGGKFWGKKYLETKYCDDGSSLRPFEQYAVGIIIKRGVAGDN